MTLRQLRILLLPPTRCMHCQKRAKTITVETCNYWFCKEHMLEHLANRQSRYGYEPSTMSLRRWLREICPPWPHAPLHVGASALCGTPR